jgi:Protein of unknown function (DUF3016)
MKIATYLALVSLVAVPFAQAMLPTQSDVNAGLPKLTVNFPNWEGYTDIEDRGWDDPGKKQHILEELRRTFYDLAGQYIPKGEHLTLTFSDIDLAGQYNVGRPGREYRSIYPPHLIFSYVLTGRDGQVLKSGREDLKDDLYLEKRLISVQQTDPRFFERMVLYDWMRNKLLR